MPFFIGVTAETDETILLGTTDGGRRRLSNLGHQAGSLKAPPSSDHNPNKSLSSYPAAAEIGTEGHTNAERQLHKQHWIPFASSQQPVESVTSISNPCHTLEQAGQPVAVLNL